VTSRGDRRGAIFRDDEDRQKFFTILGKACARTRRQVNACLMTKFFRCSLDTGLATSFYELAAVLTGIILAVIYIMPTKDHKSMV
jgi:hypothetical protein